MEAQEEFKIDLSKYQDRLSLSNKMARAVWNVVYWVCVYPFCGFLFGKWRKFVYRCFGAKLHPTSSIYASVKVWAPWNLELGENSCIAPDVDCYNVDLVKIGANVTVSQKSYLCTASHDICCTVNPLITAPILIEDQSWIAADAFIGMGVTVGQGAVVGARACVYKSVAPWTIVGGNPARFIKKRIITR